MPYLAILISEEFGIMLSDVKSHSTTFTEEITLALEYSVEVMHRLSINISLIKIEDDILENE